MKERKFFIITVIAIIAVTVFLSLFSFLSNNYRDRPEKILSKYANENESRTYNSILIRRFSFDSIILGTSLSEGFKCSEFDAAFGGQSIKLSAPRANFAEMKEFLKFAVKHKKIQKVLLDAPVEFYAKKQTLQNFPMEYYNGKIIWMRLKKSLSINMLFDEFTFVRKILRGKVKYITRDELYDWNITYACSEKIFAKYILFHKYSNLLTQNNGYETAAVQANNIVNSLFQTYPDIEFIVFFPPFSMMAYQYIDNHKYVALKEKIINMLLTCHNVKLYDFETAHHIMTDYSKYRDHTHYSGRINSWMIQEMKKNNYRITNQNKKAALEKLFKMLESYDYQKEFERLASIYKER